VLRAGRVLRAVLQHESAHMIADRKHHLRVYRRSMVGVDMVDWLVQRFPSLVRSRGQYVADLSGHLDNIISKHDTANVVSSPIGIKFGRIVPRVNAHRLTKSDSDMTLYFQDSGHDVYLPLMLHTQQCPPAPLACPLAHRARVTSLARCMHHSSC